MPYMARYIRKVSCRVPGPSERGKLPEDGDAPMEKPRPKKMRMPDFCPYYVPPFVCFTSPCRLPPPLEEKAVTFCKPPAAAHELRTTYHRLIGLLRFQKIEPPERDSSGDYVWSASDLDRARAALQVSRKRQVEVAK